MDQSQEAKSNMGYMSHHSGNNYMMHGSNQEHNRYSPNVTYQPPQM